MKLVLPGTYGIFFVLYCWSLCPDQPVVGWQVGPSCNKAYICWSPYLSVVVVNVLHCGLTLKQCWASPLKNHLKILKVKLWSSKILKLYWNLPLVHSENVDNFEFFGSNLLLCWRWSLFNNQSLLKLCISITTCSSAWTLDTKFAN